MELKLEEEITIDPETGFPALPENAYWQVNEYGYESYYLDLKVLVPTTRTKTFLLYWTKEYTLYVPETFDSTGVYLDDVPIDMDKDSIREALVSAAAKVYTRIVETAKKKDLLASFVGKYPPKNLNQL